ncbi:hypothetical protein PENANT_c021G03591 [Penicillium antarcticum]|uniref:DUF1740-domain-containing protein n=1 Tax=Penicillium antarcticum TaxID=416450 RepID=A0A1V6Q032_9EURO|nr:uncharacterized protein N7508_010938 [Penicillium antarcticum]KAJ5296117.1 hypothetical protein N7508_010938 [Penicillium antarcticum]OQD82397.1 hypothetical protein PENANT_c021G03591 [Penicillium antarcticum]
MSSQDNVPRFSSFRPLPPPPPDAPTGKDHRRRHRRRADHTGSPRPQTSRRDDRHSQPVKDAGVEKADENPDWVVDTRGDRQNLIYGTTHRYDVPNYRRVGSGLVMGAPGKRIEIATRDSNNLVLRADSGVPAPKLLSSAKLPPLSPALTFCARPDTASGIKNQSDFIPLELSPRQLSAGEIDVTDESRSYRSILGPSQSEDASTEDNNGDKLMRAAFEDEILGRNAELSRQTEREPENVTAWLHLAEHQERVILPVRHNDRSFNYAETKLVAEAKLSIYERALKVNGENSRRDHLLLARMEEGTKVWDSNKLSKEWEATLCYNSEFISLWVKYLDFCQTDFENFDFDHCFTSYVYCLKLHSNVGSGLHNNHIRTYILLRLTLFLREAGFMELAVGLWQAVLEFTCFRPSHLSDKAKASEEFQAFWESDLPRIGEPNAKGWRNGNSPVTVPDDSIYEYEATLPNLFSTWASAERKYVMKSRIPTRSLNSSKEDEAFRVVLAEDCKQILPYFWDFQENMDDIIDGFLYFCHLPHLTVPENMLTTRLWSGDNFLRNEFMDDPRSTLDDWIIPQQNVETAAIMPFEFPHHNFVHTTETLFADPKLWFSALEKWGATTSSDTSVIDPGFARSVLHILVHEFPDDDQLAEYAIAVDFACDKNLGKKYGKQLLKQRASKLRLYNAVALMHWRTGHRDVAHNIWSTALSMSQTFEVDERIDAILLWNSWIWEMLHDRDMFRVAYLLQAIPWQKVHMLSYDTADERELNATKFLRIQQFLLVGQQNSLAYRKHQVFAAYTDCLAILHFAVGHPLKQVLGVYEEAGSQSMNLPQSEETSKVFAAELLHQARTRIIYYYVENRTGQFKPAEVRERLLNSLQLWPQNTMFLSLFKWNDARLRLMDRTRDILDIASLAEGSASQESNGSIHVHRVPITTHLLSIYTELGRPLVFGSTAHSIRAAFERAIGDRSIPMGKTPLKRGLYDLSSSSRAQNNITVWKLYIFFELFTEHNIPRAREIFLRAFRACPWSKELFMIAFEHMRADITSQLPRCRINKKNEPNPPGFGFAELKALYSDAQLRGIRIHHNISGYFYRKGKEDRNGQDDQFSDTSDDEDDQPPKKIHRRMSHCGDFYHLPTVIEEESAMMEENS